MKKEKGENHAGHIAPATFSFLLSPFFKKVDRYE